MGIFYDRPKLSTDDPSIKLIQQRMVDGLPVDDKPIVKQMIDKMINSISDNNLKMKFQKVRMLSDNINNTYVVLQELLKNDRNLFKDKDHYMFKGKYSGMTLEHSKNKTNYKIMFSRIYTPMGQVINIIDKYMSNPVAPYDNLEGLYKELSDIMTEKYWYLSVVKPKLSEIERPYKINDALKFTKEQADYYYYILYGETYANTDIVQELAIHRKAYDEIVKKYSYDKKAVEWIDKMFLLCIGMMNDAINMNQQVYDISLSQFNATAAQMKSIYETIKK